jgi:hypothetical protein
VKHALTMIAALAASAAAVPALAGQGDSRGDPGTQGQAADAPSPLALATAIAGEPDARRPLARLRSPLCLVVAAEDQDFGNAVARRIIDNAKAAGVPLRRAGCRANALVTFSDDPRAQIVQFRAEGRKLFKRLSERETDAILASSGPAFVFQTVEQTPRIGEGDAAGGLNGGGENWTKERSFLRTPEDLVTTVVMIESAAIAGRDPVQMADYVTLRLLAPTGEIDAGAAKAPHTILSAFAAPDTAPRELTAHDRAYLKSLYKLPRTAFAAEVLAETAGVRGK